MLYDTIGDAIFGHDPGFALPCPTCGQGSLSVGRNLFGCDDEHRFEVKRCHCGGSATRSPLDDSWWCTNPRCADCPPQWR